MCRGLIQEGFGDGITKKLQRVGNAVKLGQEFAGYTVTSFFEIFLPSYLSRTALPAQAADQRQEQEDRSEISLAHAPIIYQIMLYAQ